MSAPAQLELGSARHVTIDTASAAIAALRTGDEDAVPVLLVPGYTGSKEDFGPLLDPLAGLGYRPTAIDLPGQFESPGPGDCRCYTPDRLAATVLDVAACLGPRVHLLGHSFGGLVARAAAIAHPAAFSSLVLMSSGPAAIHGARRRLIEHLEPLLPAGLETIYAATTAIEAADPAYVAPDPRLARFLRRRFLASVPAMLRGMGDALRNEPDRVAELAETLLPILVLYGTDDDAWPPAVQHDMARRLGARRTVIESAAHSPALENTAATVDALADFWRGTVARVTLDG
ncbi:MAG: alpha/beta fold hydrolase [Jatrophihabitantaceae bacterium]